jgi:hypothetical protein
MSFSQKVNVGGFVFYADPYLAPGQFNVGMYLTNQLNSILRQKGLPTDIRGEGLEQKVARVVKSLKFNESKEMLRVHGYKGLNQMDIRMLHQTLMPDYSKISRNLRNRFLKYMRMSDGLLVLKNAGIVPPENYTLQTLKDLIIEYNVPINLKKPRAQAPKVEAPVKPKRVHHFTINKIPKTTSLKSVSVTNPIVKRQSISKIPQSVRDKRVHHFTINKIPKTTSLKSVSQKQDSVKRRKSVSRIPQSIPDKRVHHFTINKIPKTTSLKSVSVTKPIVKRQSISKIPQSVPDKRVHHFTINKIPKTTSLKSVSVTKPIVKRRKSVSRIPQSIPDKRVHNFTINKIPKTTSLKSVSQKNISLRTYASISRIPQTIPDKIPKTISLRDVSIVNSPKKKVHQFTFNKIPKATSLQSISRIPQSKSDKRLSSPVYISYRNVEIPEKYHRAYVHSEYDCDFCNHYMQFYHPRLFKKSQR